MEGGKGKIGISNTWGKKRGEEVNIERVWHVINLNLASGLQLRWQLPNPWRHTVPEKYSTSNSAWGKEGESGKRFAERCCFEKLWWGRRPFEQGDDFIQKRWFYRDCECQVSFFVGDITKLEIDAIVNAANNSLLGHYYCHFLTNLLTTNATRRLGLRRWQWQ